MFTSLLKDMIKDADEQTEKEIKEIYGSGRLEGP